MKAKPNATTRTLRADNYLGLSSLSPELRPGISRNTGTNAAIRRERDFATPQTLIRPKRPSSTSPPSLALAAKVQ
jgi:hypothetical protein